jgi:hypothetical protein
LAKAKFRTTLLGAKRQIDICVETQTPTAKRFVGKIALGTWKKDFASSISARNKTEQNSQQNNAEQSKAKHLL